MSGSTKTFKFKPALLKKKQNYFVAGDRIELANNDGSDTIVHFADITDMRYADTKVREYRFRRLDIHYGNNQIMRIGLTLPRISTPNNDEDLACFTQLLETFSRKLEKVRPDCMVKMGETSRINWVYFAIGTLTLLSAIGILLGAYLSGVNSQKLKNTLVPIIVMAGFGAYICFMARPWNKQPTLSISAFNELLKKLQSSE